MTASPKRAEASWGSWFVRRGYARSGYLDDGERSAFASVGRSLHGARVLDLAVGGGRTASFLAPVAGSYLGIDSSPGMVRQARRRYPSVDLQIGDMRELSGFADATWDVVDISFNSIDALPHDAREDLLHDVHRVLRPGGHVVLSMLNLRDGPAERPALRELTPALHRHSWRHPRMRAEQVLHTVLSLWLYRTSVRQAREGPDWAWRPLRAHEFRFLVHFSLFGAAVRTLRDADLEIVGAWSSTGVPLDIDAERHDVDYMHFHCRRPVEARSRSRRANASRPRRGIIAPHHPARHDTLEGAIDGDQAGS